MAFPTALNDSITDSVTQNGLLLIGKATVVAMGNLYIASGQALSNAAHNATSMGQQNSVTANAATTQMVARILS